MFSFDNNTKEVNTKSDSNVELRRPTSSAGSLDGRYRRSDEIPVTSNVSTNIPRRKKRVMIGKLDEWYSRG
jgi:hypothetical protein